MTATNHALTGTAIGLLVGQPWVALPLALASHFVCDIIPHYGAANGQNALKSNTFRNYLLVEATLCGLIVLVLAITQPAHWALAAACAFVAAAPDFGWINKYRKARQGKRWQPSAFSRWASGIQWFQRPIGSVVEVAWAGAALVIIAPFLI